MTTSKKDWFYLPAFLFLRIPHMAIVAAIAIGMANIMHVANITHIIGDSIIILFLLFYVDEIIIRYKEK